MEIKRDNDNRQIANWLMLGVIMIIIQVLIGGITRLTESGLSITEWKPITGALPPMNNADWQIEFDKYRQTDQFKYVHQDFTLRDFKYIFFWEWLHRQWARLLGLVFLAGFIYFIIKGKFKRNMILPLILLFLLGALQGAVGWLMVKSGLVPERFYVGHIELTTHFMAAVLLLGFTLWFALSMKPSMRVRIYDSGLRNILAILFVLFFCQLVFGGFMAGLKAAQTAPTWPDINGEMIPAAMNDDDPWIQNLLNNPLMIHFIHRGLAYILLLTVAIFYIRSAKYVTTGIFKQLRTAFLLLILIQVALGIFTVLNATSKDLLVWLGVAHQFVAMLLVMNLVALVYVVRSRKTAQ